jgi:hypothetical protein
MTFQRHRSSIAQLCATLLLAGCGSGDKPDGIAGKSPQSAASQVSATSALSSVPTWILKAGKDEAANCYFDIVNNLSLKPGGVSVKLEKGAPLVMAGWALDKKRRGAQSETAIELASSDRKKVYLFIAKRSPRPDVSGNEAFRDMAIELPGLTVAADTVTMAPGTYSVSVIMRRGDEDGITCPIGIGWRIEL